jgi:hypothetical protein
MARSTIRRPCDSPRSGRSAHSRAAPRTPLDADPERAKVERMAITLDGSTPQADHSTLAPFGDHVRLREREIDA